MNEFIVSLLVYAGIITLIPFLWLVYIIIRAVIDIVKNLFIKDNKISDKVCPVKKQLYFITADSFKKLEEEFGAEVRLLELIDISVPELKSYLFRKYNIMYSAYILQLQYLVWSNKCDIVELEKIKDRLLELKELQLDKLIGFDDLLTITYIKLKEAHVKNTFNGYFSKHN